MADTAAELIVDVKAKESVTQVLSRLESQLDQTNSVAERLARSLEARLGAGQAKARSDTLAHAQAMARLQATSGDTAAAIRTLQSALEGVDRSSIAAIRAETQLTQLQTRLSKELSGAGQFAEAFKQGLFGFVAPAQAANLALSALSATAQSFVDAFHFKAELDASTQAINTNLQGMRNSAQVWREAGDFANKYRLTQKETNAILSASTDILRTSSSSVGDLEANLLRLQSRDISKPISEAARALRELQAGDTTSIKELFNVPAREANRMKAEIAAGGDAVQVLGAYLDRAGVSMQVLANRAVGVKGAMNELAVAQEDLALAQAKWAEGPGLTILQGRIDATRVATGALSGDVNAFGQAFGEAAARGGLFINALSYIASGSGQLGQSLTNSAQQLYIWAAQQGLVASATDQATAAAYQNAVSMDAERQGIAATIVEAQAAREAHLTHASALEEDAAKALLTAANSDELAIAKNRLAAQAQAAAQAVLAGGGDIQATAAKLAASSSLVDQLTAAYLRLASAQGAAGAAAASNRVPSDAQRSMDIAQRSAAALDRQRQLMTPLQKAQNELAAAQNLYGKNSLQAYDAQTKLLLAQQQAAKKSGGGGGGGGSTKLSDQQKLNNSLLTDQEKANGKFADAETQHVSKLLDIQADYADRLRAAQASFQQSQLEGRAGFYDNLSAIESDRIRKSASAAYEAAAQEAGQIAAAQGADVAEKYMAAQEKIISDRAKRQAEIEKAAQSGDKAKAENLKGIDDLYRKSEEARLARIKAGDDSLAAQRDKQLAEEAQRYDEATGKIAQSADRSAERKILAAQRAGQAIDAERLQLEQLAATYDRVAPARGLTSGTPAAPTPTAPTPAATTAPAGAGEAQPVRDADVAAALSAVRDAVEKVERAVKDGSGRVASAVASNGGGLR